MNVEGKRTALRAVSYNLHIGIGRDGQYLPGRTASVLAAIDADIMALQEVQLGHPRFDMFAYLCDKLAYTGVPGLTLISPRHGQYGNALLTRHPISAVRTLDLCCSGREPRGALDVDLECRGLPLRVITTHLGLRASERRTQVRALLGALGADRADRPTLLLGDLNEWLPWGRPLRWLEAHFGRAPAPATFPSGHPLLALDRAWVRPRHLISRVFAPRDGDAGMASDHLPLVIDLEYPHRSVSTNDTHRGRTGPGSTPPGRVR